MNNNDFSAFENSIAANCLLFALRATKCAKLRRGGFRPTESECYNFLGELLAPDCLNTEPQKTKTSLHRPQKPDLSFVKILPAPRPLITR
jgi:hypothetical protein